MSRHLMDVPPTAISLATYASMTLSDAYQLITNYRFNGWQATCYKDFCVTENQYVQAAIMVGMEFITVVQIDVSPAHDSPCDDVVKPIE